MGKNCLLISPVACLWLSSDTDVFFLKWGIVSPSILSVTWNFLSQSIQGKLLWPLLSHYNGWLYQSHLMLIRTIHIVSLGWSQKIVELHVFPPSLLFLMGWLLPMSAMSLAGHFSCVGGILTGVRMWSDSSYVPPMPHPNLVLFWPPCLRRSDDIRVTSEPWHFSCVASIRQPADLYANRAVIAPVHVGICWCILGMGLSLTILNFPLPLAESRNQILLHVSASSVKNSYSSDLPFKISVWSIHFGLAQRIIWTRYWIAPPFCQRCHQLMLLIKVSL